MKTQNTSGLVAGSFQPASSLAVLCGVAGEWLASGVRSARVVCMNRPAGMRIAGGGLADLIFGRTRFLRLGVCDGGGVSLADARWGVWSGGVVVLRFWLVWFLFVVGWVPVCVESGGRDG